MRVLVACEFSGRVREAFKLMGHDAWSCDLLETEQPGQHIVGDVLPLLKERWDLIIAHPPCTRLCNSGVRWLSERNLWDEMKEGARFFREFLTANAEKIAIENPVMHKYARAEIGRNFDFSCHPWWFGDNVKKRTCFWTKGLPPLKKTSELDGSTAIADCHLQSPGDNRWRERSRINLGLAKAMAEQWGIE